MPTDESDGESVPVRPQEGRWIAKPRKARWVASATGAMMLCSQLPNWINMILNGRHHPPILSVLVAIVFAIMLGGLIWSVLQAPLARRTRAEDESLVDGGFGDQFPIELTIVVQGRRIGTDRGVAWFADGLLGFSGRASSFVLAASDLVPWAPYARGKPNRGIPRNALHLRDAPKQAYVVVTPLGRHGKAYRDRLETFFRGGKGSEEERLEAYVARSEPPSGERFWPPLTPYGEAPILTSKARS